MNEAKYYPLIYIEWCDALEGSGGWMQIDGAIEWCHNEDWLIKQSSFLIEETDEYLFLSSKINPQKDGNIMLGGLLKVPKTWIRRRIDLSESISS